MSSLLLMLFVPSFLFSPTGPRRGRGCRWESGRDSWTKSGVIFRDNTFVKKFFWLQWSSLLFWGNSLGNFYRASCFALGRFEERMNCTRIIWRKGWIILQNRPKCKTAGAARSWINSVPQKAATTYAFSLFASSMHGNFLKIICT